MNQSDHLCISIEELSLLTFRVIIEKYLLILVFLLLFPRLSLMLIVIYFGTVHLWILLVY
jgi:hypothetical protein